MPQQIIPKSWFIAGFSLMCVMLLFRTFPRLIEAFEKAHEAKTFVQRVRNRPVKKFEGEPYIRRKTLVVVEETGSVLVSNWLANPWQQVWHPGWGTNEPDPFGDYLASGTEDEVQTLVVLRCRFVVNGQYTNGGVAEDHVCDGEILDLADPTMTLNVGDFTVSESAPHGILVPKGNKHGAAANLAFWAAAKMIAALDRK